MDIAPTNGLNGQITGVEFETIKFEKKLIMELRKLQPKFRQFLKFTSLMLD